jgi:hypothetical protein
MAASSPDYARDAVTRIAWFSASAALALGATAIAVRLALPGPLELCAVVPPHCIVANLSGFSYFWGDSPAAPAFHLRLVVGPLLSLIGVWLVTRRQVWTGISLTGLSAVAVAAPLFVTYALVPEDPLVIVAMLTTFGALVAKAAQPRPSRTAPAMHPR